MKGRKPKPTQQQIAEGDPRKLGVRKLAEKLKSKPRPISGIPDPPRWMSARAKWAYRIMRDDLESMDMAKHPDVFMLIGAASLFDTATLSGKSRDWTAFRSLASEFPFSPVARERFSLAKKPDVADDLAAMLSKPREKRTPATVQ